MKRRRRKIITRVVVLLIAGAIVNVAVAWLYEYRGTDLGWVIARLKERVNTHGLVEYSEEYYRQRANVPRPVTRGWPLPSLYRMQSISLPGQPENSSLESGVDASRFIQGRDWPLRLAILPLWPGFAINTIFYTAILWLLFFVPGFIRKRRRIKRGLCPACAYPAGASEVCTECGARVETRLIDRKVESR